MYRTSRMKYIFRIVVMGVAFFGAASADTAYAAGPNAPGPTASNSAGTTCVVEFRRGKRVEVRLPARVKVYWREMPLLVTCRSPDRTSPVEQKIRMPRNRWLPTTTLIGGLVMASLDPQTGYRFRKPARMTITLHPREFPSVEDRDIWYNNRKTKIEEGFAARYSDLLQRSVDCKYDSTCLDAEEEFAEEKAAAIKGLDRMRKATRIVAITPAKAPAAAAPAPATVVIDSEGRKLCLVKGINGTWKSSLCAAQKSLAEMRKITVDGKVECLFRTGPKTWETRPCPR